MRYLNRIKSVRCLGGYRLKLVFRDGFLGAVDLTPLIEHPRGPWEEALRDPAFFQRVDLDERTIAWPNGYDLCPDVLRYWCEIGRVCSQEELDAAFNSQPTESSASVLNDKPSTQ